MAKTSKGRRKAREAMKETRCAFEVWNGSDCKVDEKKIAAAFPNLSERKAYIRALVADF